MIDQVWLAFFLVILGLTESAVTLRQRNVDPSQVSVSGFSSGGAMSTQFHFVNSGFLRGAGIFAGSPYLCGGDFLKCLVLPSTINVTELIVKAKVLGESGAIDALRNIENKPVYIYHGQKDASNGPANGRKIAEMYAHFNASILPVFNISAQHGMPTNFYGAPCGRVAAGTQYITNCDYQGSFHMLNYIHDGQLTQPSSYGWKTLPGEFIEFNQGEFLNASTPSGLDTFGFLYVPSSCSNNTELCKLHMVFHGCSMNRDAIGDIFAKKAGYLEVGELNNIIMIFPQTKATFTNPGGCWDTWGFTNSDYAALNGLQNQALVAMLQRLLYG